jgi:hypothetical protein
MASRIFRIQYVSGIHLEMYNRVHLPRIVNPAADYLALAGNICAVRTPQMINFLDFATKQYQKIFYVPGTKEITQQRYLHNIISNYDNIYLLNNMKPSYHLYKENIAIVGSMFGTNNNLKKHIDFYSLQKTNIVLLTHQIPLLKNSLLTPQVKGWIHGYEEEAIDDVSSIQMVQNEGAYPLEDAYNFCTRAVLEIEVGPEEDGVDLELAYSTSRYNSLKILN